MNVTSTAATASASEMKSAFGIVWYTRTYITSVCVYMCLCAVCVFVQRSTKDLYKDKCLFVFTFLLGYQFVPGPREGLLTCDESLLSLLRSAMGSPRCFAN